MERIEKDYGVLVLENGRIFSIEGNMSDNGEIFKDYEAFHTGKGICYVSEYGLEAIEENLAELQAIYENTEAGEEGYLTDEEYRRQREEIIIAGAETRQTIIEQVREAFGDDYLLTNAQVEYFAEDVFELADWAYISTYLAENFEMEDCIAYDEINGNGIFTEFQHEAVVEGMTPKEYKERLDALWKFQNAIPEK